MNKNKILIWGTGGHASVVQNSVGPRHSIWCLDDRSDLFLQGAWKEKFPRSEWLFHVAIGDNQIREEVFYRLLGAGYDPVSIISKATYIAKNVKIKPGCFIAPGAVLQPGVTIEEGAIINTGATVDHDCVIKEFAHIAPGVNLCGNVHIGARTLVGVGVSITPKAHIPDNCIIGAGSVCLTDSFYIKGNTYIGVPAKIKGLHVKA